MKPDERELLLAAARGEWPRDASERLGIHPKRVDGLCWKWQRKGWYDYGVSVSLGWLTPAGARAAAEMESP